MTIRESYNEFVNKLCAVYDEREAQTIADWIFEDIGHISKGVRISANKETVIPGVAVKLNNALEELLNNKPVQYVLGEAWFYKMRLKVNGHVLIPRPETEELVQWIIDDMKTSTCTPTILDVGTGSGCISIALRKEIKSSIIAVDVSRDALRVASENSIAHHAEIDFREMDFLESRNWEKLPLCDIIVSNPPYIPLANKKLMAKNVVDHEPHVALFIDSDPLIFYKKIIAFADTNLKVNGSIYVEIHEDYSNEVQSVFKLHNFENVPRQDMYGRDRFIKAYRKTL